jgi:hypothetical protein
MKATAAKERRPEVLRAMMPLGMLLRAVGHVGFRRFACMMGRMQGVRMRGMGVMGGLLVMSRGVMGRRLLVMLGGVFVMLGSLHMVAMCGMVVRRFLGHALSPCA